MPNVRLTFSSAVGAALLLATAACGSYDQTQPASEHRGPITVRLKPGQYTFGLGGSGGHRLHTGDKVVCVTAAGSPAGGGIVPTNGHGVGSSTGFDMMVEHGKVRVTCPSNPGNA